MTIRALAQELYKAQRKVHSLRDQVEASSGLERERLARELKAADAECRQLRRMIEGRKEIGSFSLK